MKEGGEAVAEVKVVFVVCFVGGLRGLLGHVRVVFECFYGQGVSLKTRVGIEGGGVRGAKVSGLRRGESFPRLRHTYFGGCGGFDWWIIGTYIIEGRYYISLALFCIFWINLFQIS